MEKHKRETKLTELVMNVLSGSESALCHDDFEKKLAGKMNRVTIYRILQGFCDDGKVHKISGDNGKTYYALCHNCTEGKHVDKHPHFRCLKCDTVVCLYEPVVVLKLPKGYEMSALSCTVSGYCPSCINV